MFGGRVKEPVGKLLALLLGELRDGGAKAPRHTALRPIRHCIAGNAEMIRNCAGAAEAIDQFFPHAALSQIVTRKAIPQSHILCGDSKLLPWQSVIMDDDQTDKNGGPNFLRQWREYRGLTQEELAAKVETNANMIGYLEGGKRGLSAKWLRKLAPALDTAPGMILDHDPHLLDTDIVEIWMTASNRQKRQLAEIARTILKTGTDGD